MRRPLVAGLTVAAVLVGGAVVAVAAPRVLSPTTHRMTIEYPTASGLVAGSDVLEAGAKVGTITSITPTHDNHAMVTIQVDNSHWPLHQGVYAAIRPKSLLGEKYVDLHDGPSSKPAYNADQVLQASQDSVPVELDQFINSLDPTTRSATKILLNDLGAGVAGRGPDLNQAIQAGRADLDHFALTGQTLDNRDPDLDRILLGLDGVLQKLTQNDQLTQMSQLIDNGKATLDAIEAERQSFSRSFTDAEATLAELNTALDAAVPSLRTTLSTAPHLAGELSQEATMLAAAGRDVNSGNILQLLVTGITHGPTSSGGATETVNGQTLPIFRVCLDNPMQASCTGHGFSPPQAQGSAYAPVGGGDIAVLSGFLGA